MLYKAAAIYLERELKVKKRDQKMFSCLCVVRAVLFLFFFTRLYDTVLFVEIHAVQRNVSTRLPQNNFWWKFFFSLH